MEQGRESMGSYNSHYENYYSILKEKKRSVRHPAYNPHKTKSRERSIKEILVKRVIQELSGVLCLFLIVIFCRYINNPKVQEFYSYSRLLVNKNYDINTAFEKVKNIKLESLRNKAEEYIESIKNKLTGEQGVKEKTLDYYSPPVSGAVFKSFGSIKEGIPESMNKGAIVEAKAPFEVKCCFQGEVKEIGEDKEKGQYIIINHGEGIETKYFMLEEIRISENAKVNKGDTIGKVTSAVNGEKGYIYFELSYMGEEKNPEEYINFNF